MSGGREALAEQLAYYNAVASEYEDHAIDVPGQDELLEAIDSFRPGGDVLELACGSGPGRRDSWAPLGASPLSTVRRRCSLVHGRE